MTEDTPDKPRGRPFPKGVSGNPAGRPRGSRNKALVALDAVGDAAAGDILQKLVRQALNGIDWLPAAKIILDRAWPMSKGRTVEFEMPPTDTLEDLPKAGSAVLAAVADGTITLEEGRALLGLIESQRVLLSVAKEAAEDRAKTGADDRSLPGGEHRAINGGGNR